MAYSAMELRAASSSWHCCRGRWPVLATAPHGDGPSGAAAAGIHGQRGVADAGLEVFLRKPRLCGRNLGLGRNVGFHAKHATALEQKIRHLHHKTGRRSVRRLSLGVCSRSTVPTRCPIACAASSRWAARSTVDRKAARPAVRQGDVPVDCPPMGTAAHACSRAPRSWA